MKFIAARAVNSWALGLLSLFLSSGCANMSTGVGISFPIGGLGSIGVSVGSDGRIGGSVGVGVGPATVSVGTSGQLPSAGQPASQPAVSKPEAPTAEKSAPAAADKPVEKAGDKPADKSPAS